MLPMNQSIVVFDENGRSERGNQFEQLRLERVCAGEAEVGEVLSAGCLDHLVFPQQRQMAIRCSLIRLQHVRKMTVANLRPLQQSENAKAQRMSNRTNQRGRLAKLCIPRLANWHRSISEFTVQIEVEVPRRSLSRRAARCQTAESTANRGLGILHRTSRSEGEEREAHGGGPIALTTQPS